jgi:hypothetical protein
LTAAGAQRLGTERTIKVFPHHVIVDGSPVGHPELTGSVDVRDPVTSAPVQRIEISDRKAPIQLDLSADGFAAFFLVMQLVERLALRGDLESPLGEKPFGIGRDAIDAVLRVFEATKLHPETIERARGNLGR